MNVMFLKMEILVKFHTLFWAVFQVLLFISQREKNHGELGKTKQNMLKAYHKLC